MEESRGMWVSAMTAITRVRFTLYLRVNCTLKDTASSVAAASSR